jgi:hypothetical protein
MFERKEEAKEYCAETKVDSNVGWPFFEIC